MSGKDAGPVQLVKRACGGCHAAFSKDALWELEVDRSNYVE